MLDSSLKAAVASDGGPFCCALASLPCWGNRCQTFAWNYVRQQDNIPLERAAFHRGRISSVAPVAGIRPLFLLPAGDVVGDPSMFRTGVM